jgi:prepilin-type processing-associated H-X9-DG protein
MASPISGKGRTASPGMSLQSIAPNCNAANATIETLLADPAWYVICADAGAIGDDFCTGTLAYPDLCHLECAGPGDWEADWENCPWSRTCGATEEMKRNPALRLPYARHFGGVNIGFADGHGRWFHSEEVIELCPTHGNYSGGRLRGVEPWGPTHDAPWYDPNDGIFPLY